MNEYFLNKENENHTLKKDGLSSIEKMYRIVSQKNNHYKVELIATEFPFILEKNKSYQEIKKINSEFVKLSVNKIPIQYI